MKGYGIRLEKARSRRYHAFTIMDANCADDILLQANTPARDESLLHSQEKEACGICVHVTTDKTEYMCFNQNKRGDISPQKGELEEIFINLGSSVSSTENVINMQLEKARFIIDRLLVL